MSEVHGSCSEQFESVRETFAGNLDAGLDLGASVAVFLEGEPVVDIWGGYLDEDRTTPWERDTIINVWSTTKTMTALCALILADRGEIDLHSPVARYWPEFAAGSKDRIEIRHVLSHTAGLSGWSEPLTVEDLYDWEKCTSLLAAQEPWWEPGSASGYHAATQGFLVGEIFRRVTGETLGTFFRKEVVGPLEADFHIGTPPECDPRVAPVIPPPSIEDQVEQLDKDSLAYRTLLNPPLDASVSYEIPWRRAEIPAANGHGNARSVARVISVLAGSGETRGVRLLSAPGCEVVFEEQSNGTDLVLGVPVRFGMGFGLSNEMMPVGPRACFWGGWGGSVVIADLDADLVVAYMMNKMQSGLVGDVRGAGLALTAAMALVNTNA